MKTWYLIKCDWASKNGPSGHKVHEYVIINYLRFCTVCGWTSEPEKSILS